MGLLGGLVGGGLGGLVGGLFGGKDPTYNKQSLSESGEKAISDVDTNANRSVSERTESQMQGTKEAAQPFTRAMDQSKPEDINSALQDRLNKGSDIQMNRLKRQTAIDAASQKGIDIMTAANLHQQKYQLDRSQADSMLGQAREKDAARSSIIGSITGTMGQFVGTGLSNVKSGRNFFKNEGEK